jgi:hypothetical protein
MTTRRVIVLLAIASAGIAVEIARPGATAADWIANPEEAARRAGETAERLEGLGTGAWAAIGTAALMVLGLAKRFAPIISRVIPVWGPLIEGTANVLWEVTATKDQKAADRARDLAADAVIAAGPVIDALRAIPMKDLPEPIREALTSPLVIAALDHLSPPRGGR